MQTLSNFDYAVFNDGFTIQPQSRPWNQEIQMGLCPGFPPNVIVSAKSEMDMPRDSIIETGSCQSFWNFVIAIDAQLGKRPGFLLHGIQKIFQPPASSSFRNLLDFSARFFLTYPPFFANNTGCCTSMVTQ